MLPLPLFLLLIFSATLLAPSPHVVIGLIRIAALQPSVWNTLPVPIQSSVSRNPPEAIPELPALVPQVPLDASSTSESCVPSPIHLAINDTFVPYSFEHTTGDRHTSTVVILVVLFAMFNCFVYILLSHVSNGSRAEGKSEQLMVFPASGLAPSPSQESICPLTEVVNEIPSLLLSVDTEHSVSVSESLEQERLHPAAMPPSLSPFDVTILSQPSTPFGQSTSFLHVLSCDFPLAISEKTTDSDSNPTMLSPVDSGYPPVSASTVFEAPRSTSVEIDDPELVLLSTSLDIETAKEDTPTLLDPTNVPPSRVLEFGSELYDKPFFLPAMEDASDLDTDADGVFCCEPPELESDDRDEETFEYKGVDWTLEALGIPLTPPTQPQVPLPDLQSLSGSYHDHCSDLAPSLPVTSIQDVMKARDHSPPISHPPDVTSKPAAAECTARYALDDIRVGVKDRRESKITSITRCTSADDLGCTFRAIKATNALTISDSHAAMSEFRCDVFDDNTAHKQVTLLRADAPIFIPHGSGKVEEDLRLKAGLMASIHAPKNEMLRTEGYVGASELMSMRTIGQECAPATAPKAAPDSLESSIENGVFQTSMDAVGESNSCGYARPEESISPGFSSGSHASIHAHHRRSPGVDQTHDDNTEELVTRSRPTEYPPQRGLADSIHAPGAHIPDQAAQHSPKHSAHAPNWAAAARGQVSSTASRGSVFAQRDTSSNPPPDTDASELPTTTMRCAAKGQEEETSVDKSDGSSDHADDPEGTTGFGEIDSGLDDVDGPNEQDADERTRRTRRRGKPRRPRQKAPYIPPPRIRLLTQHPLSGQHYAPIHPPPPHHSASPLGNMVPPNIIPNHLGQHPHHCHPWHLDSLHMATRFPPPFPGFQPTGPHNPTYLYMPHPQNLCLQAPFTPLYGR